MGNRVLVSCNCWGCYQWFLRMSTRQSYFWGKAGHWFGRLRKKWKESWRFLRSLSFFLKHFWILIRRWLSPSKEFSQRHTLHTAALFHHSTICWTNVPIEILSKPLSWSLVVLQFNLGRASIYFVAKRLSTGNWVLSQFANGHCTAHSLPSWQLRFVFYFIMLHVCCRFYDTKCISCTRSERREQRRHQGHLLCISMIICMGAALVSLSGNRYVYFRLLTNWSDFEGCITCRKMWWFGFIDLQILRWNISRMIKKFASPFGDWWKWKLSKCS